MPGSEVSGSSGASGESGTSGVSGASGASGCSPFCCSSSAIRFRSPASRASGPGGVVGPGVDLELGQLLAGQAVARQHPLHGLADDLLGPALEHVAERPRADPARVAAVAPVALGLALVAGHVDLGGVDDDDEVADVDVRGVGGLGLPAQDVGDLGRQPAQGLAVGVNQVPVALAVLRVRLVGLLDVCLLAALGGGLLIGLLCGGCAHKKRRAEARPRAHDSQRGRTRGVPRRLKWPPQPTLYCRANRGPIPVGTPVGSGGTIGCRSSCSRGRIDRHVGRSAALSARARQLTP